jgi:hypothetical protein
VGIVNQNQDFVEQSLFEVALLLLPFKANQIGTFSWRDG